jgi:EmrB/QacA subfamily drug resistance transporter
MEHLDHRKKVTIMIAIVSAMLFAALNQTIVGTALPKIVSVLGGMEYFNWVFTVYMLTSSVMAILVGKLSDIYGRKPFILTGIGVFVIGSLLNGLSDSIIELIIYRGIQGIGGGMIMSTSFTAIGDLFAPREQGRWQGVMAGSFGLASVFGPTLGGWIVDHLPWGWVFWVFLPFGLVAFALIWKLFPSIPKKEGESVDYWGSLLLTLTIVPMLLAFSWAGSKFAWGSVQTIGLFAVSALALIIFILIERVVKSPVLPLGLFGNSIFTFSNLIGFMMGAGMFGAIMYMPFFVQGVMGTSATMSGYVTMPLTLSLVLASSLSGNLITRTGKYKALAFTSMILMGVGMLLLSFMNTETTTWVAILYMIIVGFGLGVGMPVFTVTVQNAVERHMLGVATASTQLFRQLGGTIGVAIMGTILSIGMQDRMTSLAAQAQKMDLSKLSANEQQVLTALKSPQALMDSEKIGEMYKAFQPENVAVLDTVIHHLREALSFALSHVFLFGSLVMVLAVLFTFFLKEIPLRSSAKKQSVATNDPLPD